MFNSNVCSDTNPMNPDKTRMASNTQKTSKTPEQQPFTTSLVPTVVIFLRRTFEDVSINYNLSKSSYILQNFSYAAIFERQSCKSLSFLYSVSNHEGSLYHYQNQQFEDKLRRVFFETLRPLTSAYLTQKRETLSFVVGGLFNFSFLQVRARKSCFRW